MQILPFFSDSLGIINFKFNKGIKNIIIIKTEKKYVHHVQVVGEIARY